MGLIIPKNNAEKRTIDATLEVYYSVNDWVSNQDLIDRLSSSLINLGIENEKKEPQSYTKKTQVLAYYGFIEWQDPENNQSPRRITDLGKKFYEARSADDENAVIDIIIEALSTKTFGRNVLGCDSESDLEAPNIFIKSTLLLDGMTNNEFAFILGKMEFDQIELADAIFEVKLRRSQGETISPDVNAKKWNDPKPITALKNWGFFVDDNKVSPSVIEKYSSKLLSLRTKNTEAVKFHSHDDDENGDTILINVHYRQFITAIKSKPFLLLAGISGTGKSRIVRELARSCWDKKTEEFKAQKPCNFEMIQVKPNWHDSSELIGYVSRIGADKDGNGITYIAGGFLTFIAKAWENLDTPYFLCLDEMNLAPVEQYFAEYLSVIESRKSNGEDNVVTDPILNKVNESWYFNLTASLTEDESIRTQFNENGITIPQNLIVVGTVNMDETTFSFSRKVLDRAMTIEMNDVRLDGGLTTNYEQIGNIGKRELVGSKVEGVDVYSDNKSVCDDILDYLKSINNALDKTPFKIAYRTRNEFLLYVVNNLPYNKDADGNDITDDIVIAKALDEITSMKILSRIEGDDTKVSKNLLDTLRTTIKDGLQKIVGENTFESTVSLPKLDEMIKRLESGYTSFWS